MQQKRRRKRYEIEHQPRFVTFSCYQRLPLFNNDAIKNHFVKHLMTKQDEMRFKLHAWVIMPEHLHLILTPNLPKQTVSTVLEKLKGPFAKQVIGRWRELNAPILSRIMDAHNKPHFWLAGGGYDRNIRDEEELVEKIAYIHDNPRRRRLVDNALNWRWSSARFFTGMTTDMFDVS